MYELDNDAVAKLLREMADAVERGQYLGHCDVALEGMGVDMAPTVHVDIEVEGDGRLVDAAGDYFDSHESVV